MRVASCSIPDVKLIEPDIFADERGFFTEIYNQGRAAAAGMPTGFVQDNLSYSKSPGTVRGLHFQAPPSAQAKLVVVLTGAAFDVALDIRCGSPSYGVHAAITLKAGDGRQLFVPAGFAHGFATLEPDTRVLYKVTAHYARGDERGIYWADPVLKIDWPVDLKEAIVSEKDRKWPGFSDLCDYFDFKET